MNESLGVVPVEVELGAADGLALDSLLVGGIEVTAGVLLAIGEPEAWL